MRIRKNYYKDELKSSFDHELIVTLQMELQLDVETVLIQKYEKKL